MEEDIKKLLKLLDIRLETIPPEKIVKVDKFLDDIYADGYNNGKKSC